MTYEEYLAEEDFLMHHGIKGQRWGIRRTPEQLGHYINKKTIKRDFYAKKAEMARRSGKAEEYNKYLKKKRQQEALIEKAQMKLPKAQLKQDEYNERQKVKEEKQQIKAEKKEARDVKKRAKWLQKASLEEVIKNQNKLTDEELKTAMDRFRKADDLVKLQRQQSLDKAQARQDKMNKAIGFADTLVKGFNKYEDIARVVNKVTGEETFTVFTDKRNSEKEAAKRAIMNSMDYNTIMANRDKLSTDELNKALDTYHKGRGENRQKAINTINAEISAAQTSVTELNSRIGTGNAQKTAATAAKTTAESRHSTAQSALSTAQSAVPLAESVHRTKKQEARSLKDEWKELEKRAERQDRLGNSSAAAALRSSAATKHSEYIAKEGEVQTAKQNVDRAKEDVNRAKEAVNRTKEEVTRATQNLENVENKIKDLRNQREQANDFIRQRQQEVWHVGQINSDDD